MHVAVIGAGVSGLVAAHLLRRHHRITVYEAGSHVGGHANTLDVEADGRRVSADVGFMVYNEVTYPRFSALLEELEVGSRPTEMSFSVRCERSGLEYAGTDLSSYFAQRRNLLSPAHYRLLADILRFNRESRALLERGVDAPSLRRHFDERGYSEAFRQRYILPMASAIWSVPISTVLDMPANFFLRFFDNHGLLGVDTQHTWRVVAGGSRSYVERLTAPFADRIRVRCPVASVRRVRGGVEVSSETGNVERFDEVVFAVHGDRVLRLLRDPSPREREVLSTFRYARSEAVLHTDTRMLPRCRRARASWNYTLTGETERPALVTYDLSRLQHLDTPRPLMLTLNDGLRVRERHVIRRMACSHPVFDAAVTQAQAEHGTISGRERIHYCGAYWRNGFHEDGVRSAETVAAGLGAGRAAA